MERVLAGHRPADVAHQMGCSRATAYKWLRRHGQRAQAALSIARAARIAARIARRGPAEARILKARRVHRRGADWIGAELAVAPSTVGRVLRRYRVAPLSECDALTGEPVRRGPMSRVRYERERPGELIHIDVKKLGRIPEGGGWRAHGRGPKPEALRAPWLRLRPLGHR